MSYNPPEPHAPHQAQAPGDQVPGDAVYAHQAPQAAQGPQAAQAPQAPQYQETPPQPPAYQSPAGQVPSQPPPYQQPVYEQSPTGQVPPQPPAYQPPAYTEPAGQAPPQPPAYQQPPAYVPPAEQAPQAPVETGAAETGAAETATSEIASSETDADDATLIQARKHRPTRWSIVGEHQTVALNTRNIVGRRPTLPLGYDAQLVAIQNPTKTMSKTHARLEVEGGTLWLTDMNSTNGTFLSFESDSGPAYQECEPGDDYEVRAGDTITFGDIEMRVVYDDSNAVADSAAPDDDNHK